MRFLQIFIVTMALNGALLAENCYKEYPDNLANLKETVFEESELFTRQRRASQLFDTLTFHLKLGIQAAVAGGNINLILTPFVVTPGGTVLTGNVVRLNEVATSTPILVNFDPIVRRKTGRLSDLAGTYEYGYNVSVVGAETPLAFVDAAALSPPHFSTVVPSRRTQRGRVFSGRPTYLGLIGSGGFLPAVGEDNPAIPSTSQPYQFQRVGEFVLSSPLFPFE